MKNSSALHCHIDLKKLTNEQLQCYPCNKCRAKSKLDYPFNRDLKNSNELVNALKNYVESNTDYKCQNTQIDKNPDINVLDITNGNYLVCRIEAKMLEGYAFMMSEKYLGDKLKPKETLVVDEPKLLSYFDCKVRDFEQYNRDVPIFVVWKFDRLCDDLGGISVFQEVNKLKHIYDSRKNMRKFERKTTHSDMVQGQKMGITEKYHFSLKECRPIEELILEILKLSV